MQIWIHLQVWVFLSSDPSREVLDFCSDWEMLSLWYRKKTSFASVLVSFLYCCILFSLTLFMFAFIRYLFQTFSVCLPHILPGEPLPPMMFPWWLVRSGAKVSSLAGVLLCFWPCAILWQFGMGRKVQHSADAKGFSCPDSRSAMLIYTNWKPPFTMLFPPNSMLAHQLRV